MDPIENTPTEPIDYAALNAAYGGLLATVVIAAATRKRDAELLRPSELVPMGAATFALSKLIVNEKVVTWVRRPFVDEAAEDRRPRGKRMRYAVGELLTCTRCIGAWAALGIVALRLVNPSAGRTVSAVLAASATNDFLQAGFTWVCGEANRTKSPPDGPASP